MNLSGFEPQQPEPGSVAEKEVRQVEVACYSFLQVSTVIGARARNSVEYVIEIATDRQELG
jgi:hypothetical protein